MSNHFRYALIAVLAAFAVVLALTPSSKPDPEEISLLRLERLLERKAILRAEVTPRAYGDIFTVKGTYATTRGKDKAEFVLTTHLTDTQLSALLASNNARLELPRISTRAKFLDILPTVLVLTLVVGLVAYQVNVGKGRGAHMVRARPAIRFSDVAGIEEAKNEVQEVIDFLRDPRKYTRLGGSLPKGICS